MSTSFLEAPPHSASLNSPHTYNHVPPLRTNTLPWPPSKSVHGGGAKGSLFEFLVRLAVNGQTATLETLSKQTGTSRLLSAPPPNTPHTPCSLSRNTAPLPEGHQQLTQAGTTVKVPPTHVATA